MDTYIYTTPTTPNKSILSLSKIRGKSYKTGYIQCHTKLWNIGVKLRRLWKSWCKELRNNSNTGQFRDGISFRQMWITKSSWHGISSIQSQWEKTSLRQEREVTFLVGQARRAVCASRLCTIHCAQSIQGIYVPRNLRICAISRLRCAFSESWDWVPISRLQTIVPWCQDWVTTVRNLIAQIAHAH